MIRAAAAVALMLLVAACDQKPPSWDVLIAAKVKDQYPGYQVVIQPGGGLSVERPGLPAHAVDVDSIARFCQRGPKDCDYAIDQLLLELQVPAAGK